MKWEARKTIIGELANTCANKSEILENLGLSKSSTHYKYLNFYMKKWGFHIKSFKIRVNNEQKSKGKIDDSLIFVKNSQYNTSKLLKRIIDGKYFKIECAIPDCLVKENWLGKYIRLQVDHINGVNTDHRLENLRLLCPNCHSQTKNFCGTKKIPQKKICKGCSKSFIPKRKRVKYCSVECYGKHRQKKITKQKTTRKKITRQTKIKWPNVETIIYNLKKTNYTQYSKVLGVSDNAIRRHLAKNNINPKNLECFKDP